MVARYLTMKIHTITTVELLRNNIFVSERARKIWIEKPDIDAWLIYNIWEVANPTIADLVPIENEHVIYRDYGIALTAKGMAKPVARQFFAFVQSLEGASIFKKWGWIVPDGMQDIKKTQQ